MLTGKSSDTNTEMNFAFC